MANTIKRQLKKIKSAFKREKELTPEEIQEIYKHVGGDKKLHITDNVFSMKKLPKNTLKVLTSSNNPMRSYFINDKMLGYSDSVPMIRISKHSPESIVAHEMAHSTSKFINSNIGAKAYLGSKFLSGLGAPISVTRYAIAKNRGLSEEALAKIRKQNIVGTAVASLPMVAEETRANIKALQALKRMGKLNLKNAAPLIVSELSYLSNPASVYVGQKLVDALDKLR